MSASAQQSFRSQLSSFRWANSVQDDSAAATTAPTSTNPFSRAWSGVSSYIPLRNEGRSQEEEAYFALSVRSFLLHSFHLFLLSLLTLPSYSSTKLTYRRDGRGQLREAYSWMHIADTPKVSRVLSVLCGRDGMFRNRFPLLTPTCVIPLSYTILKLIL